MNFKKLPLTLLAITGCAVGGMPANAQRFPAWADLVGESACTYVALGVPIMKATEQAVEDNLLWKEEMASAYKRKTFFPAVAGAIRMNCPQAVDAFIDSQV